MIAKASNFSPPRYLFVIGDLNATFVIHDDPTSEDLSHAHTGTALIVRLADWHYLGRAGQWLPLSVGIRGTAELEGETMPPFHALPEHFEEPTSDPTGPS